MPRVQTRKKNRAGQDRICGRCGVKIEPGQEYRTWSFRYGGTRTRCMKFECRPRPSDLTMSLMGEVYSAQESFEDALASFETVAEVVQAVEEVADAAEEVRSQYEEAAEPFGGQGENQERADELQGWIDELQSFQPDEEEEPEVDEDAIEEQMRADGFSEEDEAQWISVKEVRVLEAQEKLEADEHGGENEQLAAAKAEAEELVGNCPL